ncbi:MAG: Excinuclease subunit, partial [Frankiales bacterium]|nr:Excinuclease subunit [Frankiales bacterium]
MPAEIKGAHGVRPTVPRLDTSLRRSERKFEVVSDYEPAGDQPAAIAELTKRLEAGKPDVVLLGATGTGK